MKYQEVYYKNHKFIIKECQTYTMDENDTIDTADITKIYLYINEDYITPAIADGHNIPLETVYAICDELIKLKNEGKGNL